MYNRQFWLSKRWLSYKGLTVLEKMKEFDSNPQVKPRHKAFRQYMHMVGVMCLHIRAVQTGNLALHSSDLGKFVKYVWVLDTLMYARTIPAYIAEIIQLERTDPEIWSEFSNDHVVVNIKAPITHPFCAIIPVHALEQIKRWMKFTGGLVCITLNENARNRFFMMSAELVRLANGK